MPSHCPPSPRCQPPISSVFCLPSPCPPPSPITSFHLLILKGSSHPEPSVFPSAACRLSHLEKYSSPALSCPGPLPPPSQFHRHFCVPVGFPRDSEKLFAEVKHESSRLHGGRFCSKIVVVGVNTAIEKKEACDLL